LFYVLYFGKKEKHLFQIHDVLQIFLMWFCNPMRQSYHEGTLLQWLSVILMPILIEFCTFVIRLEELKPWMDSLTERGISSF
jgi:hypothetical protein